MKTYEQFLAKSSLLREMLNTYLELRRHFQELNFSEDDLVSPPFYTSLMMTLFHRYGDNQKALFNQLKDFGFDINFDEFTKYIEPLLIKINEVTPLNDGNN